MEDVSCELFSGTTILTAPLELKFFDEPPVDEKFSVGAPPLSTTITVACSVLFAQPPSIHETKANDSAAIVLLFITFSPITLVYISVFIVLYNYIYYNT